MNIEQRAGELSQVVADRAVAEGLVDVAYATVDSPLGQLMVAATRRGLVRLSFHDPGDGILDDLAVRVSPRIIESPRQVDGIRRQLDDYFSGRRREFDIHLDWSLAQGFKRRVLQAAARIPFGHVSTYKVLANEAGSPRAARAAGNALGSNPIPIVVPCHRVLHSGGGLGGYTGGLDKKQLLLRLEGALTPPTQA